MSLLFRALHAEPSGDAAARRILWPNKFRFPLIAYVTARTRQPSRAPLGCVRTVIFWLLWPFGFAFEVFGFFLGSQNIHLQVGRGLQGWDAYRLEQNQGTSCSV